ncbi:hypothetical protein Zmor_012353 [Zophobas morio]|uniref:Methyltransferase n=1 Tax=Zophobas morio TaxID=2755281 RepID=A0AA38HIE8_9CUCU|nr:hypothetical protein Zmor_012353 [Zophobas morio]
MLPPKDGSTSKEKEYDFQQRYNLKYYINLSQETEESRVSNYEEIVNTYYNMCTDFYEYGWGKCFHFAPQAKSETFKEAMMRHEHYLAFKLEMRKEKDFKYLDVGCGVGGPARAISRLTGAHIVGLNNNEHQIYRAIKYTAFENLQSKCSFLKGDFHNLPFEDCSFDGAYAIEATCHAKNLENVYSEIYRVLKPGAKFVFYEWALTDKFSSSVLEHVRIKRDIEIGNGVPNLHSVDAVIKSVKVAGFKVLEYEDVAYNTDERFVFPWYYSLQGRFSFAQFRHTASGRRLTHFVATIGEKLGLLPRGTRDVHSILLTAADSLVAGGLKGIFTPLLRITAIKDVE